MERRDGRLVPVRTRPVRQRYHAITSGVVLALIFGAGVVLLGLVSLYTSLQLDRHGAVAQAVVTDVSGGRLPRLTARYPAGGATYVSDTARFLDDERGDRIEVVYDATHPARFQTAEWAEDGPRGDYIFGGLSTGAGVLMMMLGGTVALLRRTGIAEL